MSTVVLYALLCFFVGLTDTSSCSGGDVTGNFLKKFPASCEVVNGDLFFNQESFDAAAKLGRCLDMVRIVKGRLVYKEINNTAESPCLRQLMTIEHTSDGPAIEVNHNDGLVSLGLENLKKISNKDKVVFKVHYDHYLTNATPWEVSSLVRAAGGNHEKCKEMFDVRQPGFVEPDRGVSALSWFFIIYAAVSAFIYGVILVLHVFLQPHLPKAMRGNNSRSSLASLQSLKSLNSMKSLRSLASGKSAGSNSAKGSQSGQSLPAAKTPSGAD